MTVASLLEPAAVLLVIAIAVVPLWYPRYSLFRRNGVAGIEDLLNALEPVSTDDESETLTRRAALEPGDTGFSELTTTIRAQRALDGSPVSLALVHTDDDPEYETLVVGGDGVSTGEEAALRVEFDTGETETVLGTPDVDADRVLALDDLHQWLTEQTRVRSHYATTVLAALWGTV
jgi:hypothetical protein